MSRRRVARLADLPTGQPTLVETEGTRVVLTRVNDDVFACSDECAHQGGPLSEGIVHGRKVACPLHNWIIDLEDGQATGADKGCTRSFPVKLENGRVYLDMGVAAAP